MQRLPSAVSAQVCSLALPLTAADSAIGRVVVRVVVVVVVVVIVLADR